MRARTFCLAAAALSLVAALGSMYVGDLRAQTDWVLVDVSSSHVQGRADFVAHVGAAVREAQSAAGRDDVAWSVVVYGATARQVAGANLPAVLRRAVEEEGEPASNLAAALHVVSSRLDTVPRNIVVVGDGGGASAATTAAAMELGRMGVTWSLISPPARSECVVDLLGVQAPARVVKGARVHVLAKLAYGCAPTGPATDEQVLLVARHGERVLAQVALAEAPSEALSSTPDARIQEVALDVGLMSTEVLELTVEARVQRAGRVVRRSQPVELVLDCGNEPRVDLLDAAADDQGSAQGEAAVETLLQQAGLHVRRLRASPLHGYGDVVVRWDPSCADDEAARLCHEALQQGRGVVLVHAASSAACGAAPEAALHLGAQPPRRRWHVLLDVSGSMAGEPLQTARAALSSWLDTLGADSEVWVHPFAAELGPAQRWTATDAPALSPPRGATRLVEALRATLMTRVQLQDGLLVVSDGQAADVAAALALAPSLRALAEERQVALRAVAVGNEPELELLAAVTGQTPLAAGDLQAVDAATRLRAALVQASGADARVELAQPVVLTAASERGRALAQAWQSSARGWLAQPAPDADALVQWPLPQGASTFAALRRSHAGYVLSLAGECVAGASPHAATGLATAVRLLAARTADGTRPWTRVTATALVVEDLPGAASAAMEVALWADGVERGTLLFTAHAHAPQSRQADLTAVRELAGAAARVDLVAADWRLTVPQRLYAELAPAERFTPPQVESSSWSRMGRPSRWLMWSAAFWILSALLVPLIKARALRSR